VQQLEGQVDRQGEVARVGLSMEEFCRRVREGLDQATWEQKRQLIEWLVVRVIVTDGEVEIRYAIPTSPAGEGTRFCQLRADYRDGLVTTDKFCLSRFGRLELSWWRFPLRLRARPQVNCPSPQEVSAAGGSDAAVAGASGFAAPPGRAAALGQDLSATHGLDPNTTKRRRGPGRPRASSRGGSS
jgi:hypothetical protein